MTISQENLLLVQWFKENKDTLQSVGDGSDYFGINMIHIQDHFIRLLLRSIQFDAVAEIYKRTGSKQYPEMAIMTEWPIGGVQEPHLDTYSNVELGNDIKEENPSREWTLILYLNNNFRGGETYFPDQDNYIHKPVAREGLLFQGLYHQHGVYPVRRNSRHTISMWFTTDINRAMPINPVKDLSLNEDNIRTINT